MTESSEALGTNMLAALCGAIALQSLFHEVEVSSTSSSDLNSCVLGHSARPDRRLLRRGVGHLLSCKSLLLQANLDLIWTPYCLKQSAAEFAQVLGGATHVARFKRCCVQHHLLTSRIEHACRAGYADSRAYRRAINGA